MEIDKIKLLKKIIKSGDFSKINLVKYKKVIIRKDFILIGKKKELRKSIISCFNQTGRAEARQKTKFKDLIHIGGSGKDSIKTINISTLTAMTLASMGYKVVKSGSKAYSSLLGSTDFICKLVNNYKLPVEIIDSYAVALTRYNFFYSDVTKCYPWIVNVGNIKIFFGKELFDFIFREMDRNILQSKIKIDGINSSDTESRLKHYKSYNYDKAMVLFGMTDKVKYFFDEVSNIGKTKISYFIKGKMMQRILDPNDFRNRRSYDIREIVIKDAKSVEKENLLIIKGRGREALVDLVAINVAVYLCFLDNFKISYNDAYEKAIRHLSGGRVYKHFFKRI